VLMEDDYPEVASAARRALSHCAESLSAGADGSGIRDVLRANLSAVLAGLPRIIARQDDAATARELVVLGGYLRLLAPCLREIVAVPQRLRRLAVVLFLLFEPDISDLRLISERFTAPALPAGAAVSTGVQGPMTQHGRRLSFKNFRSQVGSWKFGCSPGIENQSNPTHQST